MSPRSRSRLSTAVLRVVQVSDLHFYEYTDAGYYQDVQERINALSPDLIVFTGDAIHYGPQYVPQAGVFLASLSARYGKFGVLGNHDYADGAKSRNIQAMLKDAQVLLLKNQVTRILDGQTQETLLWLAGLDDYKKGKPDLIQTLSHLPPEKDAPLLMLAHNPRHFDLITRDPHSPVDLVLSGHTHAGHFYLSPLQPIYRWVFKMKYRYGLHQRNNTRLYVTSGLGSAAFYINLGFYKRGFPRFRYNTQPEIGVLDLQLI